MTELLHMRDNYLKEFDAKVEEVREEGIVLDRTAFYPLKGGVDCDTGILAVNGREVRIGKVVWENGKAVHIPENREELEWFEVGKKVHGVIDWERRYRIMRLHTAAHLLAALVHRKGEDIFSAEGGGSERPGNGEACEQVTTCG